MLEKIAPHLATIGIHKNGTWAAQKIIDCAKTPAQVYDLISNVTFHIVISILNGYLYFLL